MTESENENDHFDLDHFDQLYQSSCFHFLKIELKDVHVVIALQR